MGFEDIFSLDFCQKCIFFANLSFVKLVNTKFKSNFAP